MHPQGEIHARNSQKSNFRDYRHHNHVKTPIYFPNNFASENLKKLRFLGMFRPIYCHFGVPAILKNLIFEQFFVKIFKKIVKSQKSAKSRNNPENNSYLAMHSSTPYASQGVTNPND